MNSLHVTGTTPATHSTPARALALSGHIRQIGSYWRTVCKTGTKRRNAQPCDV